MHSKPHSLESREKMRIAHLGMPRPENRKKSIMENGVIKYQCSSCGRYLDKNEFYKDKRNEIGIKSHCKSCHCKDIIRTCDRDKKREYEKLRARKIRRDNPEYLRAMERQRKRDCSIKTIARNKLNAAVKQGIVKKASICENCKNERRLTAHHTDYNKPLDVRWLCYECHAKLHRLYGFMILN